MTQGLFFSINGADGGVGDGLAGEVIGRQEVIRLAALAEPVINADHFHGNGVFPDDHFSDGTAQAAEDGVLFCGDDGPGHIRPVKDGLSIDGLDGGHVEYGGRDAPVGQPFGGVHGLGDHDAAGDEGHVDPFTQNAGFPDDKGLAWLGDDGHLGPSQPHIDRAVHIGGGNQGLSGFRTVGRNEDGHIGQGPHQRQVFDHLVRPAIFADGQAGMAGADFHRQVRVTDRIADLVVGPSAGKNGKG